VIELAPRKRVTGIVGTKIPVIAREFATTGALTQVAMIANRAEVFIVAWRAVQFIDAPTIGSTTVTGAYLSVITVKKNAGSTLPIVTRIVDGAGVTVVTASSKRSVGTPNTGQTRIFGAIVQIITGERNAPKTIPLTTGVPERTKISIIARPFIGAMQTTGVGDTGIIGAVIAVITIDSGPREARPIFAMVINGAGIAIVAEESTVMRNVAANARLGLTERCQAECIGA